MFLLFLLLFYSDYLWIEINTEKYGVVEIRKREQGVTVREDVNKAGKYSRCIALMKNTYTYIILAGASTATNHIVIVGWKVSAIHSPSMNSQLCILTARFVANNILRGDGN